MGFTPAVSAALARSLQKEGIGDGHDGGSNPKGPSVLLGIPTVPRPKGVNYLKETLHAVLSQVELSVRMRWLDS